MSMRTKLGTGCGVLAMVAMLGGCAGDGASEGEHLTTTEASGVASATSALAADTPVAWKNAAGAVTGINTAALRTDFPDGSRVAAFNVLRTSDGGWALAKYGRDAAGACHTVAARLVPAADGSLHLGQLNQVISCTSALCPVYPLGPRTDTRDDLTILDDVTMSQGFCRPSNDMKSCYCSNDGGGCSLAIGFLSSTALLQ